LKWVLLERLRSLLMWLMMEAWLEPNFCRLRMRWKRSVARSRRWNGRREFSDRLFSQRTV
jgi:hypothetical protein